MTHTAHNIHLTCTVKAYTILTYLEPLVNTILVVVMGTGQEANSLLGFVRAHTHHTPVKCETVKCLYVHECMSTFAPHCSSPTYALVACQAWPWLIPGAWLVQCFQQAPTDPARETVNNLPQARKPSHTLV